MAPVAPLPLHLCLPLLSLTLLSLAAPALSRPTPAPQTPLPPPAKTPLLGGNSVAAAGQSVPETPLLGGNSVAAARQSLCLVADSRLHINILVETSHGPNFVESRGLEHGASPRWWIREVVFLWRDSSDVEHSLQVEARKGVQQAHGETGFLESLLLDETPLPLPLKVGDKLAGGAGVTIGLESTKAVGEVEADVVWVTVEGVVDAELTVLPAQIPFQMLTDSRIHFNVQILDATVTTNAGGILMHADESAEDDDMPGLTYSQISSTVDEVDSTQTDSAPSMFQMDAYRTSSLLSKDCKASKVLVQTAGGGRQVT